MDVVLIWANFVGYVLKTSKFDRVDEYVQKGHTYTRTI